MGILSYFISPLSAFSDHQTKKASKKAVAAVQAAADQNTALARNIYDTTRADLAPGRAVYGPSVGALAARAGLGGASTGVRGTAGTSPLEPSGGAPAGFDPTGYAGGGPTPSSTRAPVRPRADSLPASPTGPPMAPRTPMCRPSGSTLSRPATRATTSSRTTRTSTTNGTMTPSARTRWVSRATRALRPPVCSLRISRNPRGAIRARRGTAARTSTRTATTTAPEPRPRPTIRAQHAQFKDPGDAPAFAFNFNPNADPGYAWRQKEAARGGNASFGAKGLLKSGGAIKAAQDRSYNLADQSYNTAYDQYMRRLEGDRGQFNADRSANFNIYNTNRNFDYGQTRDTRGDWETDRGFGAGRYDQDTSNLFGLSTLGQNAAAGSATAGNIFTSAASANNNNVANARANKALSDNSNSFFNQIIPAVANVAGRYASGGF
jgi:hypothetical protein